MQKEYKLSEEAATEQMQNLMDSYDIDKNDLVIDQGPEAIETILNRLIRAVRMGLIEVLDDGSVKHNLHKPMGDTESITYKRLNGLAMKARDKAKGHFEKDCAFMGSLGNVPTNAMAKLDAVDISIVQRLAALFMVV